MSVPENVAAVVQEWVEKAENDLKAAAHTLRLGRDCPTDTVCFHAQQCVEKYLKALLALHSIPFSKTHSIRALMGGLPDSCRPSLALAEQERLSDYAVGTRYPGDYEPISLQEARRAVALARRVRSHARRLLPRQVLRLPAPRRRS